MSHEDEDDAEVYEDRGGACNDADDKEDCLGCGLCDECIEATRVYYESEAQSQARRSEVTDTKQHSLIASRQERADILNEVAEELRRAQAKFPQWPDDLLHGCAIMQEESGEAVRACLQCVYDGRPLMEYRKELVQTAAMAVRCLVDLDRRTEEGT